jgi:serine/threonine protein kinase
MADQLDRLKAALVDRYRIERELGSGGMATVYLAEDLKHRRQVAIKVLRPELAASLGTERFVREIEIAANLTHPHILPLHDSGEADGFLYYVMPFIKGESLRDRLQRDGKLSIPQAIRLTDQVASALSHSHELGLCIVISSRRTSCSRATRRSSPTSGSHEPSRWPVVSD